ncbi:MAG: hypothetical protein QG639_708 [Patescibacteria group bacterium]|jgi:hypothetical protein|nr:hypothetical protein [Patescibacteria group bacterium]
MSRVERKRDRSDLRQGTELTGSPKYFNAVSRAAQIVQEFQANRPVDTTFIDSQLMITLTADNFEDEIEDLPGHIQFAVRVIYEELDEVDISITTNAKHGVELAITDQHGETIRVIVVSSDAEKDAIAKQIAPKKLSLSQAKEYLLKEKIIVLVGPPRATYEKISKSFFSEYEKI